MRFIPASLRKLQALNWGQALTASGYQRVQLRVLCISMLLTLPVLPLVLIYSFYVQNIIPSQMLGWTLLGVAGVLGIVMLSVILWLSWILLKVSVMRWRGLGLKGAGMVGMVLLTMVVFGLINAATELAQSPELLLTGMIPLWVFKWLGVVVILQILQVLISYWMYLEEEPLAPVTATMQEPYATQPGRFETALLFLQQVWIWFGILSVPMYFIISIIRI
ncbi:MAG: hypothetical protein DI628_04515 [Blastochloris viridis]|uniref:Uncharacterized protein n=1 Tax=Blastochloris viridis TaxID=1079 RepID=A0A6N4RFG3_BLAVI|nr:MAG: hypothetical protein DI628_04515 [Blastochloris viridis]